MQLLSAGNMLKQAWAQYSKQFTAFREPLIWMLVPSVLMSLLPIIPGTTSGTRFLLGIIYTLVALWATVQIIDTSWALHEGKAPPSSLTRSLAWGPLGRVVDYALVSILYAVVVVGGFFLLIIPGILFMNWFAFSPLVTLIEGAHGTGSLKRSKELVSGRFWPMAWRWIVLNLVPSIAMWIVISILIGIVGLATGSIDTVLSNTEFAPWWTNLIASVVSVATMPFFLIASVILFAEARKTQS